MPNLRKLSALTLLGENVVIFRGTKGEAIALEDACPHQKLPLSNGNLKGFVVECGYHGLTLDCSGTCVSAPTQGVPIPKRARVRSCPVKDCYGFLWIWMGLQKPGPNIDIPNFDNPDWSRAELGAPKIACNYLYVIDNFLDLSQVA